MLFKIRIKCIFAQFFFFHMNEFLNEILNVKNTYSGPNV
jgi:hypothetical protein